MPNQQDQNQQRNQARARALEGLSHITKLRADPSFKWFLDEVVIPIRDEEQKAALDTKVDDIEANRARQRRAGVQKIIDTLDERERIAQNYVTEDNKV